MALVLLLICIECQANAAWFINTNLPSASDVTPDVKIENQEYLNAFYIASNSQPHVIFGFAGDYAQAWDVNLSNGVSRVVTMTNDPPTPHGFLFHSAAMTISNTLMLTPTALIYGNVFEYNPTTGDCIKVGTNTDQEVQTVCTSPDGSVFFGTYGHARIDEWNPTTRVFRTWGYADDVMTGDANYVYYLSADTNFIYAAVRDGLEWYLSIIERATSNKTLVWKELNPTGVTVYDGVSGGVFCKRNIGAAVTYWQLSNAVPSSIPSLPAVRDLTQKGNVDVDMENWGTVQGWDVEPNFTVYSITGGIASTSMRWKPHAGSTWSSLTETNNWLPVVGQFDIIQPWSGQTMIWITHAYGPVGTFVVGGSPAVIGPFKNQSTRDLLQVSATEAYLSGYFETTIRWNPSQSWTRVPAIQSYMDPAYNPYAVLDSTAGTNGLGIYHVELVRGYNGTIYVASRHERNSVGGDLGWYVPSTGVTGSERTTFQALADVPNDLKPARGNSNLVYAAAGGNVFIWDVASNTKLTNFTVYGGQPIIKLVEYDNDKLFGISGSNMLAFTTTGSQIYSNPLPVLIWSTAQTDDTDYRRLTLGPDNQVWIPKGTALYRINPVTGTYTNLLSITSGPDKIVFNGGDAYLYGGTQIYKLANLLTNSLSPATATIGTAHFY